MNQNSNKQFFQIQIYGQMIYIVQTDGQTVLDRQILDRNIIQKGQTKYDELELKETILSNIDRQI